MNKVIVDTSVWIDYFRGKLSEQLGFFFDELLRARQVVITDVIHHELLIGSRTIAEYNELKSLLSVLDLLYLTQVDHDEFNKLAWQIRKKGLNGQYTDLTIAYWAHKLDFPIWSFDKFFNLLDNHKYITLLNS